MLFLSLSIVLLLYVRHSEQSIREEILSKQAYRLARDLEDNFNYIQHLMTYLGEEIAKEDLNDLTKVAHILRNHLIIDTKVREHFSWLMFDWNNTQGKMVASTMLGVLERPRDSSYRYYTNKGSKEPWKIHFDQPDIGISSGEWVIPAGMGITDAQERFIGIISLGFSIERLTKRLHQLLQSEATDFIVTDLKGNIFLKSHRSIDEKSELENANALLRIMTPSFFGQLKENYLMQGVVYSTFHKVDKYPFIVFMGYSQAFIKKELKEILLYGLSIFSVFTLLVMLTLIGIKYFIIKKATNFYEIAESISKKLSDNEREKASLSLILDKFRLSEFEAKKLIRAVHKDQKRILTALNKSLELLPKENLKKEQVAIVVDCLKEFVFQLENQTTDYLELVEVSPQEIIEKAILVREKMAIEHNVTIMKPEFLAELPLLIVDPLKLKQVLVSLLYHAIIFSPENSKIKVKTTVNDLLDKDKLDKKYLEIEIEDETTLEETYRKQFLPPITLHAEFAGMRLNFDAIKYLIQLHEGTLEIKDIAGIGRKVILRIPYINSTTLKHKTTSSKEEVSSKKDQKIDSSKIVSFPIQKHKSLEKEHLDQ